MTFVGIPLAVLLGQLLVGLINGAFYAILSLGLAVIFGLLNIVNMAHGSLYMMGAFCALLLLQTLGIGYWPALVVAPIVVGLFSILLERLFLQRIYRLDHLYGLLLTLGLSLLIDGAFREQFGTGGRPYAMPPLLTGGTDLGFIFLPTYSLWVICAAIAVCGGVWLLIERTRLGAHLRAAIENPVLVGAFGINVSRLVTLTFGLGGALAAFAGVMAAPIYQVTSLMGSNIIITVFAVVVIGGMGSIAGSVVSGFALGIIEGLTKAFYPEASTTSLFVIMVLVLLVKPSGLFGRGGDAQAVSHIDRPSGAFDLTVLSPRLAIVVLALGLVAPFVLYPVFLMQVLCMALFACAFNLLVGFGGLLSFGHAAFFGSAAYVAAYAIKAWGVPTVPGLLLGAGFAGLLGLAFGWVAIRRQGIYFAMVTLALAQMIYFLALELPFTHGEDGLQSVPRGSVFGLVSLDGSLPMYYLVFAVFVIGFAVIYRTIHSPFGQVLKAIRENEPRVISLGYATDRYKLLAFVISATLAGLAGATEAVVFQLAALPDVHWTMSGEVVLITLLGGLGTVLGPLAGAFVLVGMESYLAGLGSWLGIVEGAIFVACVLVFRRGLIGEAVPFLHRCRNAVRARRPRSVSV